MNEVLFARANEILDKATYSAAVFSQYDQKSVDRIVENVYKAGFDNRVKLAKMAHEETGIGVWEHKVLKNTIGSLLVYESIKEEKTVGLISHNEVTGISEIAQPLGPILAVTPVTNPTSTVLYKILICLKTRNPIIISPHRSSIKCCEEAVRICYEAAINADAPDDCIQILSGGSREVTNMLMSSPKIALIIATGGTGLVKAAYSSGNPAIGVGPGNVPVFIDESADITYAIKSIISSKTFDNGTICSSEQAIIVDKKINKAVKEEFERQSCYFLTPEEIKKVEAVAIIPDTSNMNPLIVGQSVKKIAEKAGISVPEGTKILLAELTGIGKGYPLSNEILAPILAFYDAEDTNTAIKLCIDLNYLNGIGHSACIYANDEKRIMDFSLLMNAGRIVVNTPTSQGAVGGTYNLLPPSLTLGCGTGGKNITTENITAKHLINIQRVCRRRMNEKWFNTNPSILFDEKIDAQTFSKEYNKNF